MVEWCGRRAIEALDRRVEWCGRRAIEVLDRRVEWCGRRAMEAPFGIKSERATGGM